VLAPQVAGFWEAAVAATVVASLLFGWLLRVMQRRRALRACE
jgi:MATE family multidrug resistance protein